MSPHLNPDKPHLPVEHLPQAVDMHCNIQQFLWLDCREEPRALILPSRWIHNDHVPDCAYVLMGWSIAMW